MSDKREFDVMGSCNFCGSDITEYKITDSIDVGVGTGVPSEAEVVCRECGNSDLWAYGYYESRQHGHNKCKKYYV